MELEDSILAWGREEGEHLEVPLLVTVTLGVVAALLVGLTVASSLRAGLTSVAVGFSLAVGLFGATVGVFELGRRIGSR